MWKDIPGWSGLYQISSEGRVWSARRNKVLTPYLDRHGRLSIGLWSNRQRKQYNIHVLVALAFHGPRPEGHEARHLDGDKANNNAENLRWGTVAENSMDVVLHGSRSKERNGNAKLTMDQVLEIRSSLLSQRALARVYRVSRQTISDIQRGVSWLVV